MKDKIELSQRRQRVEDMKTLLQQYMNTHDDLTTELVIDDMIYGLGEVLKGRGFVNAPEYVDFKKAVINYLANSTY